MTQQLPSTPPGSPQPSAAHADAPVYLASQASQRAASARDKEGWLALFADDAVVEDPVGPSGFDPEGTGHRGRDALARFYDMTIANTEKLEFLMDDVMVCGSECAYVGTIRTTLAGNIVDAQGAFTYRVDADGKLIALRAFWEVDRAMGTVRPAG